MGTVIGSLSVILPKIPRSLPFGRREHVSSTFIEMTFKRLILRSSEWLRSLKLDYTGMLERKFGRPLIRPLILAARLVEGKLTSSWARATAIFALRIVRMRRHSGLKGVVIYLKACNVLLMQAAAGQKLPSTFDLGTLVQRTNSGLPRIIIAPHRVLIRKGCTKTVKLWLTLFSLYRVIEYPGRIKLSTITDPGRFTPEIISLAKKYIPVFVEALADKVPDLLIKKFWEIESVDRISRSNRDPVLEIKPFVINRSAPTSAAADRITLVTRDGKEDRDFAVVVTPYGPTIRRVSGRLFSTWFTSLVRASRIWLNYPDLWRDYREWCYLTGNLETERMITLLQETPREVLEAHADDPTGSRFNPLKGYLGALGTKEEAAGKVRVFAMVDPFTQWMMKPLHDLIFRLLEFIPQDGTFDQTKPLDRLLRKMRKDKGSVFYSFDLSAATDRLPVELQELLLANFIGTKLSKLWRRLLVNRPYYVSEEASQVIGGTEVRYAVGQPMGARSSWAMLALTHHFVVQWAAFMVTNKCAWFSDYAVLGDDLVIADRDVAIKYQYIMDQLGVDISLAKSLIGNGLEFAKRYYLRGDDCSPISLRELGVAGRSFSNAIELARRHSLTLGSFLSAVGVGAFAKSRICSDFSKMPMRLRNYLLAYFSPSGVKPWSVLRWLTAVSLERVAVVTDAGFAAVFHEWSQKYISALLERFKKIDSQISGFHRLCRGAGFDHRPWVPLIAESKLPGYGWASFRELAPRYNFEEPYKFIETMFQRELLGKWCTEFAEVLDKRDNIVTLSRTAAPGIAMEDFLVFYLELLDLERGIMEMKTPELPASYTDLEKSGPEFASRWFSLHTDINRALVQLSCKQGNRFKTQPLSTSSE